MIAFGISMTLSAQTDNYEAAIVTLSLALAVSCGFLINTVRSPSHNPVALMAWIYIVFLFIGPGLIHLNIDKFPFFSKNYSEQTALIGSILVLMFVILFGASSSIRPRVQSSPVKMPGDHNLFLTLAVIATLCATAAIGVLVLGAPVFTRRIAAINEARGSGPVFLTLLAVTKASGFIAFAISVIMIKRQFSYLNLIVFCLTGAVFLFVNNPLATARFVFAGYLISLAFIAIRPTPLLKSILVLAAGIMQVTVFPFWDHLARGQRGSEFNFSPVSYISNTGDFDGFQSTLNVVDMVGEQGLEFGRQLASALLFFVPREFLDWKSRGTGVDAAAHAGYTFTNISAPAPAEFYVDFGFLGLAILSVVAGRTVAAFDRAYLQAGFEKDVYSILTPVLAAGYITIVMRGSLVAVLGPVCISLAMAAICAAIIGLGRRL
ncbi:MAG: hypothetical protein ACK5SW_09740 [Brevundimonas sp.]